MYVFDDPNPAETRTAEQQQRYTTARDAASRVFGVVQHEYARATELDNRPDEQPLTALERLELASLCAALASAFDRAADIWHAYQPDPKLAITEAYRQQARDLRDADALNTALAELAPATAGADPFAG